MENRQMWNTLKQAVWRWTLRRLRAIVWAADEWIHAQELKLREPAAAPARVSDEFNVAKSAARERVHKKAARAARPRLVYAGGQFVRQEGR
jgi:hypothetical protein